MFNRTKVKSLKIPFSQFPSAQNLFFAIKNLQLFHDHVPTTLNFTSHIFMKFKSILIKYID